MVRVDGVEAPARLRMSYSVRPDGGVTVSRLAVWFDDIDLVTTFLWWEVEREPLRCAEVRNVGPVQATLQANELVIPGDVELVGHAWTQRSAENRCRGEQRWLEGSPGQAVRAVHDPENDRFAIEATFDTEYHGHEVSIEIELDGTYLNRPPVAVLEARGEGVPLTEAGCPGTDKGDPPVAVANDPAGLRVLLHSDSWDPDGTWPSTVSAKRPRVDLAFEQWARREDGRWRFLGEGREVGPVVFSTGEEHELLLWITDRQGAEARALCRFQVVASQ